MPNFERTSKKPDVETAEALKLKLQSQFESILDVQIDANNVDTFAKRTLNQLILFTQTLVLAYRAAHKDTSLIGKALEDEACTYFDIPILDTYLSHISAKIALIDDISTRIAHIPIEPKIITPPGAHRPIEVGSGTGFETAETQKRLMLILYLLETDFGLTEDSITMYKGVVSTNMMRKESYVTIDIPSLNRMVYVCDETGNVTYVFDAQMLKAQGITKERLDAYTKKEKDALIGQHEGVGKRETYSKNYRTNLRTLLASPIPALGETRAPEQTSELLPQVRMGELDPWRGFLERDGVHYGAVGTVADRLGLGNQKIQSTIETLASLKGLDLTGKKTNLYSLEAVQILLKDFLALSKVSSLESDPWRGFLMKDGVRYGAVKTIARRLGVSPQKIRSVINILTPLKGRDLGGNEADLYSFEAVQAALKEYLALPNVGTLESDPWRGFFVKDGVHYGAIGTIKTRLCVDYRKIQQTVEILTPLKGRDLGGNEADLYSFEAIQDLLSQNNE